MATMVRSVSFMEQTIGGGGMRVDRDAGVIRNVRVLGKESRNGRTYSEAAMSQAAKLYEGVRVNIDHPDRSRPKQERGFAELVGTLRNVRRNDDGIRADLHIAKSHPMADLIFESAERWPENFGLSHNAEGDTSPDGRIVESVNSVRSVDLVCRPATNKGLFESVGIDTPAALELESQVYEIVRSSTLTIEEKLEEILKLLKVMERNRTDGQNPSPVSESMGHMTPMQRRVWQWNQERSRALREHLQEQRRDHLEESDADYDTSMERLRQRFGASKSSSDEGRELAEGMAALRESFGKK